MSEPWYKQLRQYWRNEERRESAFFLCAMAMAVVATYATCTLDRIGGDPSIFSEAGGVLSGFLRLVLPAWTAVWLLLLAIYWNEPLSSSPRFLSRKFLKSYFPALLAAVLVVLFIGSAPIFSDDIYRYLWEGRVLASGFNPYTQPPDSPGLFFVSDRYPGLLEHINNPGITAIYPPLPQFLFGLLAALDVGLVGYKVLFVLCYVIMVAGCLEWLDVTGRPRGRAMPLLLLPLFFLEVVNSGHLDVLVGLGLVLTLLCLERRRPDGTYSWRAAVGASTGLAICALAKVAPIVLLPHLVMKFRTWRNRVIVLLTAPLLCAVSYLPFHSGDLSVFSSLSTYGKVWEHNSFLFGFMQEVWQVADPTGEMWVALADQFGSRLGIDSFSKSLLTSPHFQPQHPIQGAGRSLLALAFAVLWVVSLWRRDRFEVQWLLLVGGGLLLSPTVHPWYLLALVPVMLGGGVLATAALWWVLAVPFSYAVLPQYWANGLWMMPDWAWWLQYGPLVLILIVGGLAKNLRTNNPPPPA